MLVILINDIVFSIQINFYPSEQCKAAASQGNGGFFTLAQDSLQSVKIRSASDALAHASNLSASSLHSP